MKKILSMLMTLCLLSGVFAAPAMAVNPTAYSDEFANAVEEFSQGQYEEFTELVELLCSLDSTSNLKDAFNSAFAEMSAEGQQRIVDEGFFGNDTEIVISALADYATLVDLSGQNLNDYYPLGEGTNRRDFLLALNTGASLELKLEAAFDNYEDVYNAVLGLKKMLFITMVSEVVELKIFSPTTSAGTLALDPDKMGQMLDIFNETLDDDIESDDDINVAINIFVDYYNNDATDADRDLIFNYLDTNGWVSIETTTGGGGGGGGFLPPVEEPVVEPEPEENEDPQDELEDESAVEVTAEVTTDGDTAVADVQVDGDTVEDALEKALETAAALEEESDGRDLQPVLVLEAVCEVEEGVNVEEVNMSLPLGDLQAAEEEGVQVALKTDLGTVVFNTEDILNGTDVGDPGSAQLELCMSTVDAEEFEDLDIPSDALIVDMTFEVNGVTLDHFKTAIKVKIPYTLKEGENAEDVTVFWIDETGTPVPMGGTYNPATGMVTFLTDHFSKYFAQTATREFSDVATGHWGYEFIANMAGKGYVNGYADGTFRPNGEITRAEFVTILVQMYALGGSVDEMSFDDISADDWYAPYVAAGYANGVVSGKTANSFDPNGKISRQEAAAMLSNVLGFDGFEPVTDDTQLNQFTDQADISSWARTTVCNSYAHGLFSGRADGRFAPRDNLSRAEAATMLYNLLNLK